MSHQKPLILGIETSCDDTACAVVDGRGTVLSTVVSSQLAAHRPFGGVVPEIASREHLRNWPLVSADALAQADVELAAIDVVAATRGPGLIGSLLVGLSIGRALAWSRGLPFHAIHHLEGHLASPFMSPPGEPATAPPDRYLGLIVSGGHASLVEVDDGRITSLAETRDDAVGEVFDKVGKRLAIAYPQGPRVDELAERGDPRACPLPIARCSDGSLDFSFSGLKSQALREIERLERAGVDTRIADVPADGIPPAVLNLLAGFRQAAVDQVLDRLERLFKTRPATVLAVSGGAAANRLLRRRLTDWAAAAGIDLRLVPLVYSGDNAAMIAHSALLDQRRGLGDDPLAADAASRIPFASPGASSDHDERSTP